MESNYWFRQSNVAMWSICRCLSVGGEPPVAARVLTEIRLVGAAPTEARTAEHLSMMPLARPVPDSGCAVLPPVYVCLNVRETIDSEIR